MQLAEATFAVVDVETTGIDSRLDAVVEVAGARIEAGRLTRVVSSFVNPGRPIPATASAVHHITDAHVRGAPALHDLRPQLAELCAGAIVVAHNARFDLGFLPFLADRPVLCSMRLAMRVIPDAPSYKNQVLRYYLGIDTGDEEATAHRALGDVHITRHILERCLERYLAQGGADDIETLVRETALPRRLPVLPFGKHRGTAIANVPTDYLQWLFAQARKTTVDARYTAECELRRRGA